MDRGGEEPSTAQGVRTGDGHDETVYGAFRDRAGE